MAIMTARVVSSLCRTLPALLIALAGLSLTSCAALPDVRYLQTSLTVVQTPTVTTPQGRLPASRAESMLGQRLRHTNTDIKALAALEEAATGAPLIAGNKITLLFDGPQTMNAMMSAISTAKNHINLETYIFDQDELGLKFADLLIAKQRAGVQVNILYDSVGTIGTPAEFFQRMRDAGIKLTEYNPVSPFKRFGRWRLNNRDHRKILVVDGKIGFTGGVNIARDYARSSLFRSRGRANRELGWRDTHIQLEGPAVASLQWLFLDNWSKQNTNDLLDRDYFPPLKAAGDRLVRVIATYPEGDFEIFKAYALAMQQARKSIHITVAYFAPDAQVIELLTAAARRGVDVKLVFPAISDAGLVFHAGRSFYDDLLDAGVKIYEFQESVLHAKTAVIDGAWSTVGSANLDVRSFLHNNEVNVVVIGEDFAGAMENAFAEDLRNSVEVTKEKWAQRSVMEKIKESMARMFEYWL
jgi:cardiolipin synthase